MIRGLLQKQIFDIDSYRLRGNEASYRLSDCAGSRTTNVQNYKSSALICFGWDWCAHIYGQTYVYCYIEPAVVADHEYIYIYYGVGDASFLVLHTIGQKLFYPYSMGSGYKNTLEKSPNFKKLQRNRQCCTNSVDKVHQIRNVLKSKYDNLDPKICPITFGSNSI